MKPYAVGLICGVLGLALLAWPTGGQPKPRPEPVAQDMPAQAFDTYEALWRKLTQEAADKLDAGEFKTDREVWDFLAKGQEPARKVAFEPLAKSEQEYFAKQGGWSAPAHAKLLRSYAK